MPIHHSALWYFEHFGLLHGLSDGQKQQVERNTRMLHLRRGQPVYLPGEPSEHVYLVKTGAVKIFGRAPEGGEVILSAPTIGVGWLYHLFNSAVIGAIFGWLFGERVHGYAPALGWGAAYGFVWWIVGALILMPIFLGMPAFAPLMTPPMRMVATGSLVGHLMFGLILGAAFVWLHRDVYHRGPAPA